MHATFDFAWQQAPVVPSPQVWPLGLAQDVPACVGACYSQLRADCFSKCSRLVELWLSGDRHVSVVVGRHGLEARFQQVLGAGWCNVARDSRKVPFPRQVGCACGDLPSTPKQPHWSWCTSHSTGPRGQQLCIPVACLQSLTALGPCVRPLEDVLEEVPIDVHRRNDFGIDVWMIFGNASCSMHSWVCGARYRRQTQ